MHKLLAKGKGKQGEKQILKNMYNSAIYVAFLLKIADMLRNIFIVAYT